MIFRQGFRRVLMLRRCAISTAMLMEILVAVTDNDRIGRATMEIEKIL